MSVAVMDEERNGAAPLVTDSKQLVARFLDSPAQRRLGHTHRRDVRGVLAAFSDHLGGRHIRDATPDDVGAWLGSKSLNRTSRMRYIGNLARFYGWALDAGLVESNPVLPFRKPESAPLEPEFAVLLEEYLGFVRVAPITAATIKNHLIGFHRDVDVPLTELTRLDVERWLSSQRLAPSTLRSTLSTVRGFVQWMVLAGMLASDPTIKVKGPREPRRLPRGLRNEDVSKLLAACPDERARLAVLLMVQEGLRCKEVAGLQVGDVDFDERTMLVRGKGGHERVLPLSDETWAAMSAYLERCPAAGGGPLVRSVRNNGRGIAPVTISRLVTALMGDAGLKQRIYDGRSAHALRHTAATDMLRSGAHIRDVQNALGHTTIVSTQRYLPLIVNDLRSAMGGRSYTGGQE